MKIANTIELQSVNKEVQLFLKTLAGKSVSLLVKRVDSSQNKAQILLGGRVFEATLSGPQVKAGQTLRVFVQINQQGQIQLLIETPGFQKTGLLNASPGLMSKEITDLISMFFLGDKENKFLKELLSQKKGKSHSKKWILDFRKNLKIMNLFSENLDNLLESLSGKKVGTSPMDSAYQEFFNVDMDSKKDEVENWQFHCFGNSNEAPYYYFFYAHTGLTGSICGSVLSKEKHFNNITLLLRFDSPALNQYFQENKHVFLAQLKEVGIEIQDLVVLMHKKTNNLDLRA